jgi:glycosyltransferase involved in cell wall biosynthesis
MRLPSVSVVMPSYNRADLIGESIENMLDQTLPPHEVIVVDDGSTDRTVDVVRGFGDRVRLIQQANAGPGAARNAGLAIASGEFVQFFDSDDLCSPDKVERQAAMLVQTGADVAYSAWFPAWLSNGEARYDRIVRQQQGLDRTPLSAFLRGWLVLIQCCLIRRDLMTSLGGYPTARRTGEDVELLFRMILAGARFEHVAGPLVMLRQHPEGQLSAAPELAPMRADDRAYVAHRVWDLLAESDQQADWIDRYFWRAEMWWATAEQQQLKAGAVPAPNLPYSLTRRAREITAGARARRTGSRLPSFFAPGPITPAQEDAVGAIGYRPVGI